MKINKFVILLLVVCLLMSSESVFAAYNPDLPDNTIRIHYHNSSQEYSNLGLWLWYDVSQPSKDWPSGALKLKKTEGSDTYVDVKLKKQAYNIGFLVVNKLTGEKQTSDRIFIMNDMDNEIWINDKSDNIYFNSEYVEHAEIVSATIKDKNRIEIAFSGSVSIKADEIKKLLVLTDNQANMLEFNVVKIQDSQIVLDCKNLVEKYPIKVKLFSQTVSAKADWKMIDRLYAYEGDDLGCIMSGSDVASLKLWAPLADKVELLVYDRDNQAKLIKELVMESAEPGVWSVVVDSGMVGVGKLEGYYYQFKVTRDGYSRLVLDPYARSMAPVTISSSGNSSGKSGDFIGKAAFVSVKDTGNTPGMAEIENYNKREDAIIYEAHIRDFTSDPSIANELDHRWGTFSAFKSRLDYIKSLGVTHIQLLPVMAWYFGDETAMNKRELEYSADNNSYNWGYDPHNYFSVDGAYSENPADAALRIAELKDLIDEIHARKMGVILDVVYTHMAKASFLDDIVPDYYFFRDEKGNLLGDFGNNLATNRKMTEKLIVDSVKHWFKEYRIDGMRWDMMGDATRNVVHNAFEEARKINPQAIFIGEGWRTFKGHLEDPALEGTAADQDWMEHTDYVGVFSDEFRNELKSGFGCEGDPMFLTGGRRNIAKLFNNIKAQPSNTPADAPGDMVQYIAAHDNLPLYDVIAQSIKKDPEIKENHLEIHKRIRLGNTLLLTSQGTSFIHGGQEYGRTKQWLAEDKPEKKFHKFVDSAGRPFKHPYFIHDSYDSSDAVNMFNWNKTLNAELYPVSAATRAYTAGLIKLRRSSDAFHLGSVEEVNKRVQLLSCPEIGTEDLVIAFSSRATTGETYYVFINADNCERKLTFDRDLTKAVVVVDQKQAGTQNIQNPSGFRLEENSILIEPLTAVVFKSEY
ncbi:MAG: pullulanase [Candidatus Rifleibacteriota bacterium]